MVTKRLTGSALLFSGFAIVLTACGGGGGGGAAESPEPRVVSVTATHNALFTNAGDVAFDPGGVFSTTISVRVTEPSGQPVNDLVSLSVSNSGIAMLSPAEDITAQTSALQIQSVAGNVQAILHTRGQPGTVVVTASVRDVAANQTPSGSVSVQVTQDANNIAPDRLVVVSTRDTLPANVFAVSRFLGSPYIAEASIIYREADGNFGDLPTGEVGVGIVPVTLATFSTADDPDTDENEFFANFVNAPVGMAGGVAAVFVHAGPSPGVVTIQATASDDGATFSASTQITIVDAPSDGRPANVEFLLPQQAQYIQGSGGTNAKTFQLVVQDGGAEPVPDPAPSNNLRLEIITETPASGELLSGTNAQGQPVQGRIINIGTTNGIAAASLVSGTEPGLVRVRATADAQDNNVSNGIAVAVVSTTALAISDGVPFSVTLTTIPVNTITVNPASGSLGVIDQNGFPLDPDATYTFSVSALVTDRLGNPPAQSTTLNFGLADAPLQVFPGGTPGSLGYFALSGADGDPQEGGTNFFAPLGAFQTAGGGAGPGDTIMLFGKSVVGNADHESTRTVTQIIDQDDLVVDEPFNRNDTTGNSVNDGPIIPYLIGRATTGNIETSAVTDSNGVATTQLNYPVSELGRTAAVYVQGTNDDLGSAGNLHTFADVALLRYPALEPLTVTATPNTILGNTTVNVLVCVEDAAGVGIKDQFVGFAFQDLLGIGAVDGIVGSGVVANPTGPDGCTIAEVSTSGILPGADDGELVFFVDDASDTVTIVAAEDAILQIEPSSIIVTASGELRTILLRYIDGAAGPVANIAISGTCEATDGTAFIQTQPAPTDANGETTAVVFARMNDGTFGTNVGTGTCTFEVAGGDPSAELTINGIDVCAALVMTSPSLPPGACTGGTATFRVLTVDFAEQDVNDGGPTINTVGLITTNPGNINCQCEFNSAGNTCFQTGSCADIALSDGAVINVTLTPPPGTAACSVVPGAGCFVGWLGACQSAGDNLAATVTMSADLQCTALFQ